MAVRLPERLPGDLAGRPDDQRRLDEALAEARRSYSPGGYRIVVRGFAGYAHQPGLGLKVRLPP